MATSAAHAARLLPRHLPPTATPLSFHAWRRGFNASQEAVAAFAAAAAAYLTVTQALPVASGRTALRLVFDTLCARPANAERHEVVLPGYTCPSLAKVVLDAGLQPRLVDIDPATLNYEPAALATAVDRTTLAVVVVHPFGLPVDLEPARAAAQAAGAVLVEDAAQSMGARMADKPVGALGDVGIYSFGPGKPMSLGGGGLVTAKDGELASELAQRWTRLTQPVAATSMWSWLRLGLFALAFQPPLWWLATRAGAQRAGESEASWGYRMAKLTASQAAVGIALLPHLDRLNRNRVMRAHALQELLADIEGITLPGPSGETPEPIYLRMPLLAADAAHARTLYTRWHAAGLGAGRMYQKTLPEIFPALASQGDLPGAAAVARRLITLPTNHHVHSRDIQEILVQVR